MEFSKTTKEVNGITKDALFVDREDVSVPQAFSKEEIGEIGANTQNHEVALVEKYPKGNTERDYYVEKTFEGKSRIDLALEDITNFLSECDKHAIT